MVTGISAKMLPAETLCKPLILISSIIHDDGKTRFEKQKIAKNKKLKEFNFIFLKHRKP